jgi:hypothetical protein
MRMVNHCRWHIAPALMVDLINRSQHHLEEAASTPHAVPLPPQAIPGAELEDAQGIRARPRGPRHTPTVHHHVGAGAAMSVRSLQRTASAARRAPFGPAENAHRFQSSSTGFRPTRVSACFRRVEFHTRYRGNDVLHQSNRFARPRRKTEENELIRQIVPGHARVWRLQLAQLLLSFQIERASHASAVNRIKE